MTHLKQQDLSNGPESLPGLLRQITEHYSDDHYVIKFISAEDIPTTEYRAKSDPYLRAHISVTQLSVDPITNQENFELKQLSPFIITPKKLDSTSVTWNCYRDFRVNPPSDAMLTVDILHSNYDTSKPDLVLGSTHIPLKMIENGEMNTLYFSSQRVSQFRSFINLFYSLFFLLFLHKQTDRKKNPKFSVTLQRVWIDQEPPKRKTFFLIRHGQSKWNLAQSKRNIGGMLDRDHGLTELGAQQAQMLNHRWKEYDLLRYHESQKSFIKKKSSKHLKSIKSQERMRSFATASKNYPLIFSFLHFILFFLSFSLHFSYPSSS
jgi:hypothetical protein